MAQITAEMLKNRFGITVKSEFVPWTKSRNFDPAKHIGDSSKGIKTDGNTKYLKVSEATLNWKVTLCKDDREIITTDYSAGIAHAPSYKNHQTRIHGCRFSILHAKFLEHEVEKGTTAYTGSEFLPITGKGAILPETPDVVYSMLMDSDAIDYPTFEEWADNFGYDRDSRKGEAIYRQCLEIGLKIRAGLGDSTLAQLRELFQDF